MLLWRKYYWNIRNKEMRKRQLTVSEYIRGVSWFLRGSIIVFYFCDIRIDKNGLCNQYITVFAFFKKVLSYGCYSWGRSLSYSRQMSHRAIRYWCDEPRQWQITVRDGKWEVRQSGFHLILLNYLLTSVLKIKTYKPKNTYRYINKIYSLNKFLVLRQLNMVNSKMIGCCKVGTKRSLGSIICYQYSTSTWSMKICNANLGRLVFKNKLSFYIQLH